MFTHSRDPNTKHKRHTVIKQATPSLLVSKNNEMMKIKETPMLDLNLLKNHLYNTFVLLLVKITLTEQITNIQNPMIDTVVELHHVTVIQIAKSTSFSSLKTDTDMTEPLLLHNLTDQDLTSIDEIHVFLVHHTDLFIDHHIDEIHVLDKDHVHTRETDHLHNILRHIDLLPNHESIDLLDLDQVLIQKIKLNPFQTEQSNSPINFENHMYHPTEMPIALTPTSWFYSLCLHTPER